jgi:hypothetical protein
VRCGALRQLKQFRLVLLLMPLLSLLVLYLDHSRWDGRKNHSRHAWADTTSTPSLETLDVHFRA